MNLKEKEKTTGTFLANQFNSTDFTKCCGIAVLKTEDKCPKCGATIISRQK